MTSIHDSATPEPSTTSEPSATPESESVGISTIAESYSLRWRLVNKTLPLYERHMRSLKLRGVSAPLLAWIRCRLEWTIDNLLAQNPEGVLCLDIDPTEDVKIALEPPRTVPTLTQNDLFVSRGHIEGVHIRDASDGEDPLDGVVWIETDGALAASAAELVSATNTLVRDLAETLGYRVTVEPVAIETIVETSVTGLFLVNDEFGLLPIDSAQGPIAQKMTECFDKLWDVL